MFDYQEKQQIKEIFVNVLEEYGLIKTQKKEKAKQTTVVKEDLKMTDEEERLYDEYLDDFAIYSSGMGGGLTKEEWVKIYRKTGSTSSPYSGPSEPSLFAKTKNKFIDIVTKMKIKNR